MNCQYLLWGGCEDAGAYQTERRRGEYSLPSSKHAKPARRFAENFSEWVYYGKGFQECLKPILGVKSWPDFCMKKRHSFAPLKKHLRCKSLSDLLKLYGKKGGFWNFHHKKGIADFPEEGEELKKACNHFSNLEPRLSASNTSKTDRLAKHLEGQKELGL